LNDTFFFSAPQLKRDSLGGSSTLQGGMQQDTGVTAVAHVIQLAVAPVFLLTGIGAMLSVMTSRLARVVDRARTLEREVPPGGTGAESEVISELSTLSRRAKLIGRSITLCTITALLICAVIAVLFLGAFLQLDTATTVALLFIAAMVAFFAGLALFLFWRFDRSLLTLLWVAEAFAMFVLSAVLRENQFRHVALAGLGLCVGRLILVDLAETHLGVRGLVFVGVGLLMLGMNAIYNRYRARFQ